MSLLYLQKRLMRAIANVGMLHRAEVLHAAGYGDAAYEQGQTERTSKLVPMQSLRLADERWKRVIIQRKTSPCPPSWWKQAYLEGHYDLVRGSLKTAYPRNKEKRV